MQEKVAPVFNIKFDFEICLEKQLGVLPLPFPGMDKSAAPVCENHIRSYCTKGTSCPFRHIRGDKSVVCKHWLRGLCKKGDACEFLHEYDMNRMPECYFYSRFSTCHNQDCPFLHLDPESRIRDCPWYDRGFCRHGPDCHNRHIRKQMCANYLAGFCSKGAECPDAHPRFEIPGNDMDARGIRRIITCHNCGEHGHKISSCMQLAPEVRNKYANRVNGIKIEQERNFKVIVNGGPILLNAIDRRPYTQRQYQNNNGPVRAGADGEMQGRKHYRNLDEVTCFKCGDMGHFANRCPKGFYGFMKYNQNEKINNKFHENKMQAV